jgi:hypothetical protein
LAATRFQRTQDEGKVMTPGPKYLVLAILSGLFLTAVNVKPASADPPPWAGRWYHPVKHSHHDDDRDDDDDDDGGKAYRGGYYGGRYDNGYYGGACGDIVSRIDNDRMSIDKIVPTGRHRKALRWYQEDLQKAQRDLYVCRQGGGSAGGYGPYSNRGYDPTVYGGYDSGGDTGSFKDDWPYWLGTILSGQIH